MTNLSAKLFGVPEIRINGEPVIFSYKKTEALFYYLLVEKTAYRRDISVLLWESVNDASAKKNLRNAIYSLKNVLGDDIILTPNRELLVLNPDIPMEIDVDDFSLRDNIHAYTGLFLEDFSIKNSYSFDEWLSSHQLAYKEKYINYLYQNISAPTEHTKLAAIEESAAKYIEEDPYDERPYHLLMKSYLNCNLPEKGISVYSHLYKLLNDDLGINPNQEVTDTYLDLLNQYSRNSEDQKLTDTEFESHTRLLNKLTKIFDTVYHLDGMSKAEVQAAESEYGIPLRSGIFNCAVIGENGIGKSYLVERFLNTVHADDMMQLTIYCFQSEKRFLLQPFNTLLIELEDYINSHDVSVRQDIINDTAKLFPAFGMMPMVPLDIMDNFTESENYQAGKNGLLRLLSVLTGQTRILLYFDNMNSMDDMSLDILSALIKAGIPRLHVILSCLDIMDPGLSRLFNELEKSGCICLETLKPLRESEVTDFIRANYASLKLSDEQIRELCKRTDGNTFFLLEILQNLDSGQADAGKRQAQANDMAYSLDTSATLNDRLNGISPDARQLLDILSVFQYHVSIELLTIFLNRTSEHIRNLIEELKSHALLAEYTENHTKKYSFKHNMMQQFVYKKLSPLRVQAIHHHAGESLEQLYSIRKYKDHSNLIHHFALAHEDEKVLYYKVRQLEDFILANYELYPNQKNINYYDSMNLDNIMDYFNELEQQFTDSRITAGDENLLAETKARFYNAKSCYTIENGLYKEGLAAIDQGLQEEYFLMFPRIYLRTLRQKIIYGIQMFDTDLMFMCVDRGLEITNFYSIENEKITYNSLRGLTLLMLGEDLKQARYYLEFALKLYTSSAKTFDFSSSLARVYNYTADCLRLEGNYEEALFYTHQAIPQKNSPISSSVYNATGCTNAGRILLEMGKRDEAKAYFVEAFNSYRSHPVLYRRGMLEIYLACYHAIESDVKNAGKHLRRANTYIKQLASPEEFYLLYRAELVLLKKFGETYKDIIGLSVKETEGLCKEAASRLPAIHTKHLELSVQQLFL